MEATKSQEPGSISSPDVKEVAENLEYPTEWEARIANLQKRYPHSSKLNVVEALRKTNGHAGRALEFLGVTDIREVAPPIAAPDFCGSPDHSKAFGDTITLKPEPWVVNMDQATEAQKAFKDKPEIRKSKSVEIHSLFVSEKFPSDRSRNHEISQYQVKAKKLMTHPKFDALVASAIVINSIFLGVQTDHADWSEWQIVETVFCLIFTAELALRIYVLRLRFFQQPGGLFDGILIAFSILDLIMSNVSIGGNDTLILRILRLSRIARLLRLIKLYQPLYLLISSLQKSVGTVCWIMCLLLVTLYAFAIFTTKTVGQSEAFQGSEVKEHFTTVSRSMLSLFTIVTFEGWYWDFAQPIMEEMPAMGIFFILFLCCTSFSVLNVFTAMIVESTMGNARELKSEVASYQHLKRMKHVCKLKQIFANMDVNGDGELEIHELRNALEDVKVTKALKEMGIPKTDALALFDLLDLDKSASLTVHEFVDGCLRMAGEVLMARDITMSQYTLQRDLRKLQDELAETAKTNAKRWEIFDGRVEDLRMKVVDLTNDINVDSEPVQNGHPEQDSLECFCTLLEQAFGKAQQRKAMKTSAQHDKTRISTASPGTGDHAAGVSATIPNQVNSAIRELD